MYKLVAVGKDNIIHAVDVSDKSRSCCEKGIPIKQVNPNFYKLNHEILWCYECSYLLELQEGEG
ncbi:hypothetical protein vBVpaMR16F_79 [Vibrio phage vB_VpaM_R16F]|nr:hypothetical protein vBVpaMR16F_79 [Vibrio phage vB_VpaM_R16F]